MKSVQLSVNLMAVASSARNSKDKHSCSVTAHRRTEVSQAQNSNKQYSHTSLGAKQLKILESCLFKNWKTSCEKLCWLPGNQAVNNTAQVKTRTVYYIWRVQIFHMASIRRGACQKGICSCSRSRLFTLQEDLPSVQKNNAHTRNQCLSDEA